MRKNRNLSKALTSHRGVKVRRRAAAGGIFGGPRGGVRGDAPAVGQNAPSFSKKEKKS